MDDDDDDAKLYFILFFLMPKPLKISHRNSSKVESV
jgi:hypothetical protein